MSLACGWLSADPQRDTSAVVNAMGRALRVNDKQEWACWRVGGLSVGLWELPTGGSVESTYTPAISLGGRYHLWMAGEAYAGNGLIGTPDVDYTRTLDFRKELLAELLRNGMQAIRELDGEYQIVLWDTEDKTLTLLNDRFGGLPLYWGRSSQGFAFAGGVRGVLMAPGVPADPDPEALREAVSFGYRLRDRTNVKAVKMLPGASVLKVKDGRPAFSRYWRWSDIQAQPDQPIPDLVDEIHHLWQRAIRRRLTGAKRPGELLSGGLDSRAILAEAIRQTDRWTAITYGLAGCDDARYAQRAAEDLGATWVFHPLYSGRNPDWLDCRTRQIYQTDGLIDLHDLKYTETIPLQSELLDVHLSGYIGDAVIGPTFSDVTTADLVLKSLPFHGMPIGLEKSAEAPKRAAELISDLQGAPARFAVFENKLPQSTNLWVNAFRPWLRVRKPFVDYAFFDFCQGLPAAVRGKQALYERWLRSRYPAAFAAIPNQRTGMPVLTANWRVQVDRVKRFTWRKVQPYVARIGLPERPRIRNYTADEVYWRTPDIRDRIEGAVLRPGSLSCEILGRDLVSDVVTNWFEHAAGPVQCIGTLYVYEVYHRDLSANLHHATRA